MMEARRNQSNNRNHPEITGMQRHPSDPLRGVVVDNHCIASRSRIQLTEKLGKRCCKPLLFPLGLRTWESHEANGHVQNKTWTYGFGVDPTDLRFKLCEAHE